MPPLQRPGLTWQTLLHSFIILPLFCNHATAGIVNRTIDDTFGDSQTGQVPVFLPSRGVWADPTCVGCAIKADTTKAFKGTYEAATYNSGLGGISITMDFEGTDIYVFFILANNQGDGITTITVSDFAIDGKHVGSFTHAPDLATTAFQYNALVFSQNGLPNAVHTLNISTSGVDYNVYVNFDYVIYTHVDLIDATTAPGAALGPWTSVLSKVGQTVSSTPDALSSTSKTLSSTRGALPNSGSISSQSIVAGASSFQASASSSMTIVPTAGTDKFAQTSYAASSSSSAAFSNKFTSSQNPVPVGAIAGGAVGGVVLIGLLIVSLVLCRRRHRVLVAKPNICEDSPPAVMQLDDSSRIHPQRYSCSVLVTPDPFRNGHNGNSRIDLLHYEDATSPTVSSAYYFDGTSDSPNTPTSHTDTSIMNADRNISPPDTQPSSFSLRRSDSTVAIVSGIPGQLLGLMTASSSAALSSSSVAGQSSVVSLPLPESLKMQKEIEIGQARRYELNQRMLAVKAEMRELRFNLHERKVSIKLSRREAAERSGRLGQSEEEETAEEQDAELRTMRDMMNALKEEVRQLRVQQMNDAELGQGLVEEPPPEYTPRLS